MSLAVESRHCGKVYVVRCSGRIVAGEEVTVLESSVNHGLREFTRIVLHLSDVTRVDSTGMGLLVRFLAHTKNRGGDLRLAACPPFLANLLQLTRLTTIFHVYDSEEEAIVSFIKEPAVRSSDAANVGPLVLFIDQSADLCAFVRTLLHHHGYEVLTTCRLHDAKTLLSAMEVKYIVLGPDNSHFPSDSVMASLKSLAPTATTLMLPADFKHDDPDQAGLALLRMLQQGTAASA